MEKPFVETEHLMSSFDRHYEQVVQRQLKKDSMQVKQKYANATELGEGENRHGGNEQNDYEEQWAAGIQDLQVPTAPSQ